MQSSLGRVGSVLLVRVASVVPVIAALAALSPRGAAAAPSCELVPAACVSTQAPADGASVPANAPALPFLPWSRVDGSSGGASDVILTRADGSGVDAQVTPGIGGWLLTPAAPLAPGDYRLLVSDSCGRRPTLDIRSLHVTPALPLPTSVGAVHPELAPGLDDCGASTAVLSLHLRLSDDLAPFAAVTRFTLEIDGDAWAVSSYGAATAPDNVSGGINFDHVYTSCTADGRSSGGHGLQPGHHQALLHAHPAGAAVDPAPLAFAFDLDCSVLHPVRPPDNCCGPFAGCGVAPGGIGNAVGVDGSGIGGTGSMTAAILVVGLGLAAAFALRRTRRRRADSARLRFWA